MRMITIMNKALMVGWDQDREAHSSIRWWWEAWALIIVASTPICCKICSSSWAWTHRQSKDWSIQTIQSRRCSLTAFRTWRHSLHHPSSSHHSHNRCSRNQFLQMTKDQIIAYSHRVLSHQTQRLSRWWVILWCLKCSKHLHSSHRWCQGLVWWCHLKKRSLNLF